VEVFDCTIYLGDSLGDADDVDHQGKYFYT